LSRGKQFCGSPAWSPNDGSIVFLKNDNSSGGTSDIYTINVDGSNETRLTTGSDNFPPQYFSNSNEIIFSARNGTWFGIYKMNGDGSNKQLLTPPNGSFVDPRVSPDDSKIVITSLDWNGSQIFVMNADGSGLKQLTFSVSSNYYDTGFPRDGNNSAVWSPNSSRLAYVSFQYGSPDIFTINADGSANKRLTKASLRDESPCWTKDGNYILFSSNRDTNMGAEIYIMRSEGQLQTPLTNYIADDVYPVFIEK
jgi:Tol biopolymer transport system component